MWHFDLVKVPSGNWVVPSGTLVLVEILDFLLVGIMASHALTCGPSGGHQNVVIE